MRNLIGWRGIFLRFSIERCAVYRAYCGPAEADLPQSVGILEGNSRDADEVRIKDFALTCFPVEEAVAEFHTSGTTREQSGKHFLSDTGTLSCGDWCSRTSRRICWMGQRRETGGMPVQQRMKAGETPTPLIPETRK